MYKFGLFWCPPMAVLILICKFMYVCYLEDGFVFLPISVDYKVTQKSFNFGKKHNMPFYFVSAADGTNVVKVSISLSQVYCALNTDLLFCLNNAYLLPSLKPFR